VGKGLVERLPDPADRRGVQVRLTTPGKNAVDGALDALLKHEQDLLAGLSAGEATTLASALRTLSLPFDR
jgi:DNA-binding MarR family transcriptional regulator